MALYYFDTSALVKRYINEPGSTWIRQICNARNQNDEALHVLLAGSIAMVEFAAAFAILQRRQIILKGVANHAFQRFISDWDNEYRASDFTLNTIKSATTFGQRHPLKAYDAVHLALALETRQLLIENELDLIFVSGDARLLQAAQAEGLTVENPFTYSQLDNPPIQENSQ